MDTSKAQVLVSAISAGLSFLAICSAIYLARNASTRQQQRALALARLFGRRLRGTLTDLEHAASIQLEAEWKRSAATLSEIVVIGRSVSLELLPIDAVEALVTLRGLATESEKFIADHPVTFQWGMLKARCRQLLDDADDAHIDLLAAIRPSWLSETWDTLKIRVRARFTPKTEEERRRRVS